MENWGLITYRETDLLYSPTRDLESNKRRVSLVVSHELAHQWVRILLFAKRLKSSRLTYSRLKEIYFRKLID